MTPEPPGTLKPLQLPQPLHPPGTLQPPQPLRTLQPPGPCLPPEHPAGAGGRQRAGAVLPLPLQVGASPAPAAAGHGAGCCLSLRPDGAVTLGSSGRSPWLAALLRHLLPPRAWERLCSPASRALRGQEGHPGFWRDAEMSGAGILRLSGKFLLSPAQGCRVWFQEGERSLLRRCHLPAGTGRTGSGVRPAGRSLLELFSGHVWLWGVENWEMVVLCPMRVCPWHRSHAVPQGTADLQDVSGLWWAPAAYRGGTAATKPLCPPRSPCTDGAGRVKMPGSSPRRAPASLHVGRGAG